MSGFGCREGQETGSTLLLSHQRESCGLLRRQVYAFVGVVGRGGHDSMFKTVLVCLLPYAFHRHLRKSSLKTNLKVGYDFIFLYCNPSVTLNIFLQRAECALFFYHGPYGCFELQS